MTFVPIFIYNIRTTFSPATTVKTYTAAFGI